MIRASSFAKRAAMVSMVSVIAISAMQVEAMAERKNLFEILFAKQIERKKQREAERRAALAEQQEAEKPAPIQRVKGPQYYRYKPQGFAKLDLAPLASALAALKPDGDPQHSEIDRAASGLDAIETASIVTEPHTISDAVVDGDASSTAAGISVRDAFIEAASHLEALELMVEPGIGKAMITHYQDAPAYLWISDEGKPNARARSLLRVFAKADEIGLSPQDYLVEFDGAAANADVDAGGKAAMAFEMALTVHALRFMADSRFGVINPNRISGYHDFPTWKPDHVSAMKKLSTARLPVRLMADIQPDVPAFEALKAELAELTSSDDDEFQVSFAPKTLIKPGETSDQLEKLVSAISHYGSDKLKSEHGDVLASYSGSTEYSKPLIDLVKAFQRESGLGVDGIVGRNTIAKLTGQSSPAKIKKVRLAMERLRWHPESLGNRHVFINQPAYRASYVVNDKTALSMRAIVGKRSNQTYFFHDVIERVEYNPYWGVPRSILVNEMLPKLRANPSYLDERGYEVTNSSGKLVASASVDWNSVGSNPGYFVRQTPGASNALGELKIMFPNAHAIYMHDTPSRGLFQRSARALSHGCIRLHKPREMAAAVLGKNMSHVKNRLGAGHNSENVSGNIPVYVSYFTAWPNDAGKVNYYGDIYGRDTALAKAFDATRSVRDKALLVASR